MNLFFDGACTIQKNNQASMSVSLAQGEYCDANNLDPEDPRCAHVIFTGRVQVVRQIIIFHIVSISYFEMLIGEGKLHRGSIREERIVQKAPRNVIVARW